jgi:hypothetical protein
MLGRIWTLNVHRGEDIQSFSNSLTTLAAEYVSFREGAILIFSLRTSWPAGARRNFTAVGLNGSPPLRRRADPRLFIFRSTIPCAGVLLLYAAVIFATSSDVSLGFLKNAAAREVLIFTRGNY